MSQEEKAKQDVIEAVFYDDEHGYGSKANTLKNAKEIDKSITMDDINKFMNKVSFRNKKGYTNYNSFVVNYPRDEFMVDLIELGFLNGDYYYCFICLDIFSKFAYGIEIPNKHTNSTAIVLKDVLEKMGIPKAIASDDGPEWKGEFKKILQAEGIEHIVFTTHLSFIDRFTRTIKNMLFERVEHSGKSWHLLLPSVIKQYNNTIHSSTGYKPIDAIHDKHVVDVKTNLILRSRFKRKYKEINVGDEVRVFKKKQKYSEMKEHVKNWSDEVYRVIHIDKSGLNGQVSYKLEGLNKLYFRNEILLVE